MNFASFGRWHLVVGQNMQLQPVSKKKRKIGVQLIIHVLTGKNTIHVYVFMKPLFNYTDSLEPEQKHACCTPNPAEYKGQVPHGGQNC